MNKKRFAVLALILAALMVLTLFMIVACDKNNGNDDPAVDDLKPTEGLLISNSDFKVIGTSGDYPRSITDWSGAKLYSSGSYPNGVIAGAISLEKTLYADSRSKWNDDGGIVKDDKTLYDLLASHYSAEENAVNNALMIYMPTEDEKESDDDSYGPTAYGYSSKSFNLDKASYYKLSIDVLTYKIAGTDKDDNVPGARIYVSANTYAEFSGINTNGEWKTYTVYFESAATSSTSLTLNLSLGKYSSSYTNGLTTGYAFFDNVELTKLETTDNITAEAQFDAAKEREKENNDYIQTVTAKVPNGRFDFGTTAISSSAAASNWSVVTGNSDKSDPAPTSLGYNGIIDASKFAENMKKYAGTVYKKADGTITATSPTVLFGPGNVAEKIVQYGDDRIGDNIYMLSQQMMTAQGLKSAKSIVIEKNRIYHLTLSVYTFNIRGAGVTLTLSGEGEDISIQGISQNKSTEYADGSESEAGKTNGGWQTFSFYIKGNEYKDMSYLMTLWLGTGGTSENNEVKHTKYTSTSSSGVEATTYNANGTFSTGWAFFDELNLSEITSSEFENANGGTQTGYTLDASNGAKDLVVSLHSGNLFNGTTITGDFGDFNAPDADTPYAAGTLGTPKGFSEDIDWTDDTLPSINPSFVKAGVVNIGENADFSAYGVDNPLTPYDINRDFALMMLSSTDSTYAMKTADFTIEANKFYRISFWVKTADIKKTSGIYVYLMDKDDEAKKSFTLINTEDYDEYTNDWAELTIVIRGGLEDADLHLKFTLGTGSRWTSSTLAKGAAFVTNMSMVNINYADYDKTSDTDTTYVKKLDLTTASATPSFTNGAFNEYDYDEMESIIADGKLDEKAGIPKGWSITDKKLSSDSNLVAGTVKMDRGENGKFTTSQQIGNLFGNAASNFDNLYNYDDLYSIGGPSMLALAGLNNNKYSVGYTTKSSFKLSAGSNYTISIWVKAIGAGTVGSIYLSGEASGTEAFDRGTYFVIQGSDTPTWQKYTFNIEVGLTAVNLKLGLWLGYDRTVVDVPEDEAASSGIILFDTINMSDAMTSDEFDAIGEADYENGKFGKKISFLADSFDSVSDEVESRSELSSPSGWTGSVGTDQEKDNTKSGVLYVDRQYVPTDENDFISILGPKLEAADFEITQSEVNDAKTKYPDKTDQEIIEILQQEKLAAALEKQMLRMEGLSAKDGKRMLVINNIADSAYLYTSSSYTLKAEKSYRISVWARTFGIDEGKGSNIELYLGSANDADAPLKFLSVNSGEWKKYTFYVKANDDDVTSVTLKLGLGVSDPDDPSKLVSGYAMFDAVEIEMIDEQTFDTLYDDSKLENPTQFDKDTMMIRVVTESPDTGDTGKEPEVQTPDTKFDLDNLWWMIPTILLALATIAVVIVFFVKKFRKPKKDDGSDIPDPNSNENLNKKHSNYDSFNE